MERANFFVSQQQDQRQYPTLFTKKVLNALSELNRCLFHLPTVLQELPRRREMLRVRVPRPPRRGHAVPRAPETARAHPGRQLLRPPRGALRGAQGRHLPARRRSREIRMRPIDINQSNGILRVKWCLPTRLTRPLR